VQRLSRAEAQERTRAAILDTATTLFLRDGFGATSLERIAEQAGYTHGAVYSNFKNKTAIGVAVVDGLYQAEEQRARTLFAAAAERGTPWHEALAQWAEAGIGDIGATRLEAELAALSGIDGPVRDATAARYRGFRERWGEFVANSAKAAGVELAIDTDLLALAVIGLGIGVGIQRVADPGIQGTAFAEILRAVATVATRVSTTDQESS